MKPPPCVVDRWTGQLDFKTEQVSSLFPGQGNLVNKNVIAITVALVNECNNCL